MHMQGIIESKILTFIHVCTQMDLLVKWLSLKQILIKVYEGFPFSYNKKEAVIQITGSLKETMIKMWN